MNEIINWAAQNNTLLLQVAFSVVLVLLLIYVYRLFFVASSTSGSNESSAEIVEVNQKLSQLLEQQKSGGIQIVEKVVVDSKAAAATSATAGSNDELELLKAELAKLKNQLNESEKKVFELTPIAGAVESRKEEAPKVDPAQIAELNKKIEELQSRLSEYDIIADDIAELSQLRSENADLKKKMVGASGLDGLLSAVPQPAEVVSSEIDSQTSVASSEPLVSNPEVAPTAELNVEPSASAATNEPAPIVDAETAKLLESFATEAPSEPQSKPQDKIVMDQNVPELDKNLMNEFEKSTQKGS